MKRRGLAAFVVLLAGAAAVVAWPIVKGGSGRSERRIDFTPVPMAAAQAIRADIAPDDLVEFVDVRRVDFPVRRGSDLADEVWEAFANNAHEQSFGNVIVTKDNFARTLATYQAKLVGKATAPGLPSHNLQECLHSIETSGSKAVLPVGAYLAKYAGEEIWILVCKWEGMSPEGPVHLSHVRIWALRAADQAVLAFRTCM